MFQAHIEFDAASVKLTDENTNRRLRRALRQLAKADIFPPVYVVRGSMSPPTYRGRAWHYETTGGQLIRHPGAYSKKGWSSMVYMASSLCVEVGGAWLAEFLTGPVVAE